MLTDSNKLQFSIASNVVDNFIFFSQNKSDKPESGGILTGALYEDYISILNCSTPTADDKQSRFNFVRSRLSGQSFIDEKFVQSKGKEIYLGEWHTHPELIPVPSKTDIESFRKTIKKNKLNSQIHFMIIVGIKNLYVAVYCKGQKARELTIEMSRDVPQLNFVI